MDALHRYSSDSDCKLFIMILNGVVAEEVRDDQLTMLVGLKQAMSREDAMMHGTSLITCAYLSLLVRVPRW